MFDYKKIKDYKINKYSQRQTIASEGSNLSYIGFLLKGELLIKTTTLNGYEFLITKKGEGDCFGDSIEPLEEELKGDLIVSDNTEILTLSKRSFLYELKNNDEFLSYYLTLISKRNIAQQTKIKLLGQPSIREKILFFIKEEMTKQNSNVIKLSMNKEELASYLSLNRPSLSRELIRMKKDHIIDFDKWSITYLN